MWAEISRLSYDEYVTVLLTTHYLDQSSWPTDWRSSTPRRLVVEGTPDELKSELRGDTVHVELSSPDAAAAALGLLTHLRGLHEVDADGRSLRARAEHGARAVPAVLAALEDAGVAAASVAVARPTLDDVYLRHVGRSFEVAA